MDVGRLVEWIKLTPRYLLPIFAAATVLLFAPEALLSILGMESLLASHRGWIGVAWLLSASLLLTHLLVAASKPINRLFHERQRRKTLERQIARLSSQELRALTMFIDHGRSTVHLPMSGGVAGSLEAKKVIFRSANISLDDDSFAYSIQPWAWEYLREHPELLQKGREFAETPAL